MADLSTKYLGLELKNPIVPSASPISKSLDGIKKLEDAGAPAVILYSLFEEQFRTEVDLIDHFLLEGSESFAEAVSYFPDAGSYHYQPDEYLEHVRKSKESVHIPIIASLNGLTTGGWIDYAKKLEEAGADALELNTYYLAANPAQGSAEIEQKYLDVLQSIKRNVSVPVALKLSPFFTATANMARRLSDAGADALVLFNRFYQPDIDLDTLTVKPGVTLSSSADGKLPMRWIAILYGRIRAQLAASSGVHSVEDVIKMLMAGASVVQTASALLENGPAWLTDTVKGLDEWLDKKEYDSVREATGVMSQQKCAEPAAFERANYMKSLSSYQYISDSGSAA